MTPSKEEMTALRNEFPVGSRVRFNAPLVTSDFSIIVAGTEGVVDYIENCGCITIILDTHITFDYFPQFDENKVLRSVDYEMD
jgi:hypothetical protein